MSFHPRFSQPSSPLELGATVAGVAEILTASTGRGSPTARETELARVAQQLRLLVSQGGASDRIYEQCLQALEVAKAVAQQWRQDVRARSRWRASSALKRVTRLMALRRKTAGHAGAVHSQVDLAAEDVLAQIDELLSDLDAIHALISPISALSEQGASIQQYWEAAGLMEAERSSEPPQLDQLMAVQDAKSPPSEPTDLDADEDG